MAEGEDPLSAVRVVLDGAEKVGLPEGMEAGDGSPPEAPPPDGPPGDGGSDDMDPIRDCAALPEHDVGNGHRFRRHFGQDVMWVPRVGWFVWDGARWCEDLDEIEVRKRGQQVSGLIEREVWALKLSDRQMEQLSRERELRDRLHDLRGQIGEDGKILSEAQAEVDRIQPDLDALLTLKKRLTDLRSARRKFAKSTGNKGRIDALLSEGGVHLARRLDELNADPLMVNTETGVLVFRVIGGGDEGMSRTATVERVDHQREQLLTKSLAAAYVPGAGAPRFDAFMARVQPNVAMRRFLQRWFGYSLTGLTAEQKLCFFYGAGANGKSVLVDLMARIMADYAAPAKIESLIGKNRRSGGDATPDLIPLVGARFVRASEPEEGERLQEAKIKELTGGEPILIRGLNADFFEALPIFKLTISGNHKPEIRGGDDGIWRRVLLVPFDVQIPPAERDPHLVAKLFDERDGILNWLVEGLIDYLENGLDPPAEVLEATEEYRADSDPLGQMLGEVTEVTGSEHDFITSADLVDAFQFWLDQHGWARWSGRTVSLRLADKAGKWRHPTGGRTFIRAKSGTTGFRGIRLTDAFRDDLARRPAGKGGKGGQADAPHAEDWNG